ncbi:MAG: hypothetical protein M3Y91_14210 [Actinomycetota bacterium]|nr:hypothetical protein [Actinomycetota bacterium]
MLATFGEGAHMVFPGSGCWAINTTDRNEIVAWFEWFAALRPRFTIHDVVAQGPPWAMTLRTRGADRVELPSGYVYTNEWVQCGRMVWGKLREDIVYLDTERIAALEVAQAEAGAP